MVRGHRHHPAREAGQETRRRANGANAPRYSLRGAHNTPHGETPRRNIPEREKGHGAGKGASRRAPTGGRTRTTGAGRYAAPTTAAHRSGESREEMKKARRRAGREASSAETYRSPDAAGANRRQEGKPRRGGEEEPSAASEHGDGIKRTPAPRGGGSAAPPCGRAERRTGRGSAPRGARSGAPNTRRGRYQTPTRSTLQQRT